jgi:hypothetical protein
MQGSVIHEVENFDLDGMVDDVLDKSWRGLELIHDSLVQFCVESWKRAKYSRSEVLNVLDQVLDVAAAVSDPETPNKCVDMHDLFIHMCQRNVRKIHFVLCEIKSQEFSTRLAGEYVKMREKS